jgi:hypothetical protein
MAKQRKTSKKAEPEVAWSTRAAAIAWLAWQRLATHTGTLIRRTTPTPAADTDTETPGDRDGTGLALLLAGLYLAAALWTHPGGPLGALLSLAAGLACGLVGWLAPAVPALLAAAGVQVMRHRSGTPRLAGQAAGLGITAAGLAGLAHLAAHAGGLLGALTGGALAGLVTVTAIPVLVLTVPATSLTTGGPTSEPMTRRTRDQHRLAPG